MAFTALFTGLVQSLGTTWGLFRHYWVLAKLMLTVFATAVLMLNMPLLGAVADAAVQRALSSVELRAAREELVFHAAAGLLVLLIPAAMSVYKPQGVTRYGWRKQHEQFGQRAMSPPWLRPFRSAPTEPETRGLTPASSEGP